MSIYDELSLQDVEALSQVDDGADIVGMKHPYETLFSLIL